MATLYRPNGIQSEIQPMHGKKFTLGELQEIVAGPIEFHPSPDGKKILVVNEEGLNYKLPPNPYFSWDERGVEVPEGVAVIRMSEKTHGQFVGNCLLCSKKEL